MRTLTLRVAKGCVDCVGVVSWHRTKQEVPTPGLIAWYSRQGFMSTGGQNLRLYMKVATARKYLEQK